MAVQIDLPEDIEESLEKKWGNLPRHALEALAIEGYRTRVLSRSQVRRMLGFETRTEVDELMMRAGIPFDYTLDDFEHDAEASQHLKEARAKELQRR
jgi:predicted HTH domain antitoxin